MPTDNKDKRIIKHYTYNSSEPSITDLIACKDPNCKQNQYNTLTEQTIQDLKLDRNNYILLFKKNEVLGLKLLNRTKSNNKL